MCTLCISSNGNVSVVFNVFNISYYITEEQKGGNSAEEEKKNEPEKKDTEDITDIGAQDKEEGTLQINPCNLVFISQKFTYHRFLDFFNVLISLGIVV